MTTSARQEVVAGMRSVAPMLVAVVPFGLVCGATPATNGVGGWGGVGFSTIVFAGASQLAAIDVLGGGGSAIVAIVAACTINLRMLLYSASLAPHVATEPLRQRMLMAYVLTDQAYAVSITRWSGEAVAAAEGGSPPDPSARVPFYLGGALLLWVNWQICTVVGIAIGSAVPERLPLDFAVPLVFLVLLVPAISSRPAVVAAAAGGCAAVAGAQVGAGHLSILVGAVVGIAAGTLAEIRHDRRTGMAPGDQTPVPPAGDPHAVTASVWLTVVGAGIGTYAMRLSFLAFAHRLADVPPAVQRVLRQIPPAALASIVVPALLRPEGRFDLFQARLLAGVIAGLVAWRTRNVALTLVVGMAIVMLLDLL